MNDERDDPALIPCHDLLKSSEREEGKKRNRELEDQSIEFSV